MKRKKYNCRNCKDGGLLHRDETCGVCGSTYGQYGCMGCGRKWKTAKAWLKHKCP